MLGSVFLKVFFTVTLSNVVHLLQNFVHIVPETMGKMLQIWLLYDFYFLVCAYTVAEPYFVVADVYDHADAKFSGIKISTKNSLNPSFGGSWSFSVIDVDKSKTCHQCML